MKILLFGKNGQLGWELQRALAPIGELIVLDRHGMDDFCGDLTNLDGIAQTIQRIAPDVVVNAGAYTAVDKAENEQRLTTVINAEAPETIAREAAAIGALFLHYSTDYVFDGTGSKAWQESDSVAPLNHYGKSKLAGELAIQKSGCNHLIVRTSWVYGIYGNNFVKSILHLAETREELKIVDDQIGAPTGADLLADISAHALRLVLQTKDAGGLYHLAPLGSTSWYAYANYIVTIARSLGKRLRIREISAIPSAEYVTPAQRPLNSRLDTTKIQDTFSLHLPSWEIGVTRLIKQALRE